VRLIALFALGAFAVPRLDATFGNRWLILSGAVCLAIGTYWEWGGSFRSLLHRAINSMKR
jgi:hypothetical protein